MIEIVVHTFYLCIMALINQEQAENLRTVLDSDTLKELIDMYESFAQEILREIFQQITTSDYTTLKATAHNLKGSSANIGAEDMQLLAKQMEYFALESDVAATKDCHKNMKEILPETITALYKTYGI